MSKNEQVKEITNMEDDFAQWYTDVVLKTNLADYSLVKGCMIIKPYGYAIWENIQKFLDNKFKELGHKNVYLPLLIPESLLNVEKEHVEGFAPEVAWVTHGGSEKLEERLCIRPTSETLFSDTFAKEVSSWRDLPLLWNQWCNVLRWEKTTRPFLRSAEFLWQEGHTVHATEKEAVDETLSMLETYKQMLEELLAIPVVKGKKTEKEKFAGAEATYTVEVLMKDGRALQSATSHYFGQNFTKPFNVKFQNKEEKEEYAYQTSWGTSTRNIAAIIMVHGDNKGLQLPPRVAPTQVIIVPIAQHKEGVLEKAEELKQGLKDTVRIDLDSREGYSTGYKFNDWEMRGVPVRLEIGPKDIENNNVVLVRRDTAEKLFVKMDELKGKLPELLETIQKDMYRKALELRKEKTNIVTTLGEFESTMETNQGFVKAMLCNNVECEDKIKELTGATARCLPFEQEKISDKCVCCGKPSANMLYFGRQY